MLQIMLQSMQPIPRATRQAKMTVAWPHQDLVASAEVLQVFARHLCTWAQRSVDPAVQPALADTDTLPGEQCDNHTNRLCCPPSSGACKVHPHPDHIGPVKHTHQVHPTSATEASPQLGPHSLRVASRPMISARSPPSWSPRCLSSARSCSTSPAVPPAQVLREFCRCRGASPSFCSTHL